MGAARKRGEVAVACEKLKAALVSRLQPQQGEVNTGLFQAIELVNSFLFAQCEDVQAFSQLKENVRKAILTQRAPSQSTKALNPTSVHSQPLRARSALGARTSRAFDGPNGSNLLHKANLHASRRAQTTLPAARSSVSKEQQQLGQQCYHTQGTPLIQQGHSHGSHPHTQHQAQLKQQSRMRQRKQRQKVMEARGILGASQTNQKKRPSGPEENLTQAQIEAELSRIYAYGSKKGSVGMDWTMPPSLMHTKAFAMSVNDDMGKMVKMQDILAEKAELKRKEDRHKQHQEHLKLLDRQMAEVLARRREEALQKRSMGLYMDGVIADSKSKDAQEKRAKEEQQAALHALFTSQLKERADMQRTADLQLEREMALERMYMSELERQSKEAKAHQVMLNRAKNEAMKKQLDEALKHQAQERAREIQEERKATKEYMQEMDRQELARQMVYKGRQDKLKALFERAGGMALIASMEEKAAKDEADMMRAQALVEVQEHEKERLTKMRQEEMDRERKAVLDQQLAQKEAASRAQVLEMRRIKEKLDAEQAADKEAAHAAKVAECARQAKEREALKQAVVEENMRRYYTHNEPMTDQQKLVHKKVLNMEERGFASLTLPKHNPMCLLKDQ